VVVLQQPKVKPSTTIVVKPRSKSHKRSNANTTRNAYIRLLNNPFDNSAFGAKVADPFSSFTDAFKLHGEFKMVAPAATTTGAYVFKPNPFLSVIDVQSWSGGTSTSSASAWNQLQPSNSYFWGATTPGTLVNIMANYRVVSHGVRIRLEMPQQIATGRMIIARAPRAKADIPFTVLNGTTIGWSYDTTSHMTLTTIPPLVANSPFILEVPEAIELSAIDMMGRDVVIVNKPNSYRAFDFCALQTDAYLNSNQYAGDFSVYTSSTGVETGANVTGIYDNSAGWDDFYVYFDGLPTTATPVVNFEVILHLEGTPQIASATAITAVPTHPPAPLVEYLGIDKILRSAAMGAKYLFTDTATMYSTATGRNLLKDAASLAGFKPRATSSHARLEL